MGGVLAIQDNEEAGKYTIETKVDDPRHVWVPPNLSGLVRVVITLPPQITKDDVLEDLEFQGFINGVEEHDIKDGDHIIIKRKTELEAFEMVEFLNEKYGYIAQMGYVKPDTKLMIEGKGSGDVLAATHMSVVVDPSAPHPNDQFHAFRREYNADTGIPRFHKVNLEKAVQYVRAENVKNEVGAKFGLTSANQTQSHQQGIGMEDKAQSLAMSIIQGDYSAFDTEEVKEREALKLDYIDKARHLRRQLQKGSLHRKLKKKNNQKLIRNQFKYDYANKLILHKKKKWGYERSKKIYKQQKEKRLLMAKIKQIIDPNIKEDEYTLKNKKFWDNFGADQ